MRKYEKSSRDLFTLPNSESSLKGDGKTDTSVARYLPAKKILMCLEGVLELERSWVCHAGLHLVAEGSGWLGNVTLYCVHLKKGIKCFASWILPKKGVCSIGKPLKRLHRRHAGGCLHSDNLAGLKVSVLLISPRSCQPRGTKDKELNNMKSFPAWTCDKILRGNQIPFFKPWTTCRVAGLCSVPPWSHEQARPRVAGGAVSSSNLTFVQSVIKF
jgi:hypothetical protein